MNKHFTYLILLSILLSSCSTYAPLTTDKYAILYHAENVSNIKLKFKGEIHLKLSPQDTVISHVTKNGTAKLNYVTRYIDVIPKNQKVKIVEATENYFVVEFEKYDLQFFMIQSKKNNFIVSRDNNGNVYGTNYKIDSNNPHLVFKMRKKASTQTISLLKND